MNTKVPQGLRDRLKIAQSTEEVEILLEEAARKRDASDHTRRAWIRTARNVLNRLSGRKLKN